MYQLTEDEINRIEAILDHAEDHPGFVNGTDVAAIGNILLRLFKEEKKPAKRTPAKKDD